MSKTTTRSTMATALMLTIAGVLFAQGLNTADALRPTLFVVGDSTASNGPDLGWGSYLGKYFDPDRIIVINRARAGRSSRTFITEGLWGGVLDAMKAGDYVADPVRAQ